MILHLDEGVVFVGNRNVVNVDEAVSATGEETSWQSGMELHFCYIVVVAFDIILLQSVWRSHVPVIVMSPSLNYFRV